MEMVRQRVVDGLNRGVVEHCLVGSVGTLEAELLGPALGESGVARGDPQHGGALAVLHRRDHLLASDLGGAEHTPGELRHSCLPAAVTAAV